jgi:membrane protease subunit (stomatin/prohibitin family)
MSILNFLSKQFIEVIQWTEPAGGVLAWRYPMQDQEIRNGARLTVRESEMAAFVNEGRVADVFGPGLYKLTTHNLPLLTDLMNWDKAFQSPFKSDVYFFSTRVETDQHWGTATPIVIRDQEFGAVRLRAYGIYSWHLSDVRAFHQKLSGTRDLYRVSDLEGQLRDLIIGRITDAFAESKLSFLDMAANQVELGRQMAEALAPMFAELGLKLDSFVVENVSLPEELQQALDQRIGMNMVGDMSRFTQYEMAKSLPIAAANESGGLAGTGVGLAAGMTMAQQMMNAMKPAPADTAFCIKCGKSIPKQSKFCAECGAPQQ